MKKYVSILLMSLFVVSCAQQEMYFSDIEPSFYAEIEQPAPSDLTKTYYDTDSDKVLWDNGDLLTLFTGTSAPLQYRFAGGTGVTGGKLILSDNSGASSGDAISHNYAVYPYSEDNGLDGNEKIVIKTSGIQTYPGFDSFGENDNVMVAASDNTSFSFKNVCGWIIFGLSGEGQVSSITLKGNNDEIIAGDMAITMTVGGEPSIAPRIKGTKFTNLKEITLTCPEPVTLSSTATDFWIAVRPMTFSSGFSFTVTDPDGRTCTKSLSSSYVVERSKYRRIATTITYPEAPQPNNVIYYTSTDGNIVTPYKTDVFGANIISNEYVGKKGIITFDGDVTSVGAEAFRNKKTLTSVSIPNGVTIIGLYAFYDCTALESASLPNGLTKIESVAFMDCSSLQEISIPESVTEIGSSAFIRCSSLSGIINIPEGIQSFGDRVFAGCDLSGFTGKYSADNGRCLIVGDAIVSVATHGLSSYTIPYGVKEIDNAFNSSPLTSVIIPNTVETIGDHAFYDCRNLQSIEIPNSVTLIGYDSFVGSGLVSITIPSSVKKIDSNAFEICRNLESVTIENGVSIIGDRAFYNCFSLSSITLPESVNLIYGDAFSYCTSLSSVTVKAVTPPAFYAGTSSSFSNTNCPIFVPAGSVDAYNAAWKTYADRIKRIFQTIPISTPKPEAIDLGLSVKWASFNLGASKPCEYGGYYAWGETEQKDVFGNPTYRWSMASFDKLIKYCTKASYGFNSFTDSKSVLDSEDDAAHMHLGGNWRLPTKDELTELKDNCSWESSAMNGVNGWIITGPNGNSIFLPTAGGWSDSGVCDGPGVFGHYWSSSICQDYPSYAYALSLSPNGSYSVVVGWGDSPRMFGYSIRPVTE